MTSDMEADDDAPLEPLTDNDDNKETKGGKLPSVAIYSYLPSQNISTLSVNDPESPCECCFKVGQECFSWKGWACYKCKTKKIQCPVKIYNLWKCETNTSLQSGELVGSKKPPKLASAEDSSHKKGTKQWKTRGTAEDTTKVKGKDKGKAVDAKASKVQKQGELYIIHFMPCIDILRYKYMLISLLHPLHVLHLQPSLPLSQFLAPPQPSFLEKLISTGQSSKH